MNQNGVPTAYADIIANLNLINVQSQYKLLKAIDPLIVYLQPPRPPIITKKFFNTLMKQTGEIYINIF